MKIINRPVAIAFIKNIAESITTIPFAKVVVDSNYKTEGGWK
jgi:hypothetical protein